MIRATASSSTTSIAGRLSADPLGVATVDRRPDVAVVTVQGWTAVVADPVAVVDDLAGLARFAEDLGWRDETPALGVSRPGALAVGWISDDLTPSLLGLGQLGAQRPAPAPLPPVRFALHDVVAWIPPGGGPVEVVAQDVPGSTREPRDVRTERARARAAGIVPDQVPRPFSQPLRPTMTEAAHRAAVSQALEWIAAGDLYQLNLTFHVRAPWPHGGAALARRLWTASPGAAHAAWIRAPGGVDVVSVSPETFLRTRGARVTTRPIKGTRPRRSQRADDAAEAGALEGSAKDGAEHVMIVDLARNDLGRVATTGSVDVVELAGLEAHPTVWHLTSTVEAELRDDVGLDDLIAATFPCGSVTGAPKRMAWSRIVALEPWRRGAYCGAIGVVGPGLVDLSVAIRTAVVHDGVAVYGIGGGIVADSEAASEWNEAWDKAAAFRTAVGAAPHRP